MRRGLLLLVIAIGISALARAESPADYAWSITVTPASQDALYRLDIPADVYRGAVRADLGDLRVFNGAGELVPLAFQPRPRHQVDRVKLNVFPIYGDASKPLEGMTIRIAESAAGTSLRVDAAAKPQGARVLKGYLVDLRELRQQPLQALDLEIGKADAYAGTLKLEQSADLASWTLLAQAPLVSLTHDGATLKQRRASFAPCTAKYLRLSWSGLPVQAELSALSGEIGATSDDALRQHDSVAGASVAGRPGEILFDTGGRFPVDRISLALPEPNTTAQVEFLSRPRADGAWRPVMRATVYRLVHNGTELRSPALAIAENSDRYWLLRVDQNGGGFGAQTPKFEFGWLPAQLVWAGRGSPPFTIAFGSGSAQPSAYPIDALLPGVRQAADTGAVSRVELRDVKPAELGERRAAGGEKRLATRPDFKPWLLWLSLLAVLGLLSWMAWRLWRQMDERNV